ncbi:MAG: hypothetical protein WCG83_02615 [Candidatus Peregrinibacteria bacterium]
MSEQTPQPLKEVRTEVPEQQQTTLDAKAPITTESHPSAKTRLRRLGAAVSNNPASREYEAEQANGKALDEAGAHGKAGEKGEEGEGGKNEGVDNSGPFTTTSENRVDGSLDISNPSGVDPFKSDAPKAVVPGTSQPKSEATAPQEPHGFKEKAINFVTNGFEKSLEMFQKFMHYIQDMGAEPLMNAAAAIRMIAGGEYVAKFLEMIAGGNRAAFISAMKKSGLSLAKVENAEKAKEFEEAQEGLFGKFDAKEGYTKQKFFLSVVDQWKKNNVEKKQIGPEDIAALTAIADAMPEKNPTPEKPATPAEIPEQVVGTADIEGKNVVLIKRAGESLFRMEGKDFRVKPTIGTTPIPGYTVDLTEFKLEGDSVAIGINTIVPLVPKRPFVKSAEFNRVRTSVLGGTPQVTLAYREEAGKDEKTIGILFEEVKKVAV